VYAPRLEGAATGLRELFCSQLDLCLNATGGHLVKSAVAPVSVGAEYSWVWAGFIAGPVKTAGDIETWEALEVNFLDTVIIENLTPMDDTFQRSLSGQWPDSLGDQ